VTSFLEMPNTRPLTTTQQTLDDKLQRASQKCLVNYGFFIGATGRKFARFAEAKPTPGIKIFMGSMHGQLLVAQDTALADIFAKGDRLIAVHAEDQARLTNGGKNLVESKIRLFIQKFKIIWQRCWQRSKH
jgi:dihydroorotase